MGAGTACSGQTIACCLPDGSCLNTEPLCCSALGGTPSPSGAVSCLGDLNGDGIDDACELKTGACCLPDGSCINLTQANCGQQGGIYKGDGTHCAGDINGNGADDACEPGWRPGDPYKMHFPQLPDETGWDVMDMMPFGLADDWMCTETGPVSDIHFWGSWLHGVTGEIISFTIGMYSDIPAAPPEIPFSRPGNLLWQYQAVNFGLELVEPQVAEGWYDPATGLIIPMDHFQYYQYNVYIPEADWFIQEQGTIYWLSITANLALPGLTQWGWKSSLDHWNDDAVWTAAIPMGPWLDLFEPPDFQRSMDLSFVITGQTQPCDCRPGDANGDLAFNIGDAVYIINYVFKGGPPPAPYALCSGDANCDCSINIGDAVYIINYIFKGGPVPCDCQTWLSRCGPPLRK